jgi:LmbE family N-acetylglucosaminyl deacetylase
VSTPNVTCRRDDHLVVRGAHQRILVSLSATGIDVAPPQVTGDQTALVEVSVEATTRGRILQPWIESTAVGDGGGRVTNRQYFERAVHGRRYVNLSPAFTSRGAHAVERIDFRACGARLGGEATLRLFDPPDVVRSAAKMPRVLVLAPHPDDAEIAAFGLYAERAASSWVVTITAGELGGAEIAAVVPPGEEAGYWKAHLRVWDSLTIPQTAGVAAERCANLVYPDKQLASMFRSKGQPVTLGCERILPRSALRARNADPALRAAPAGCTWGDLVADLRRVVEAVRPDVIVAPHPLIDGHEDHRLTTVALTQALDAGGSVHDGVTFLLYVVQPRGWVRYPFGPADSLVSLPPWSDGAWVADSIYSHPLSPRARRAKYFAVEAHHDARVLREHAPAPLHGFPAALRRELGAVARAADHRSSSYLRRAPRPNEIFYVVSRRSLDELVARALEGGAGGVSTSV